MIGRHGDAVRQYEAPRGCPPLNLPKKPVHGCPAVRFALIRRPPVLSTRVNPTDGPDSPALPQGTPRAALIHSYLRQGRGRSWHMATVQQGIREALTFDDVLLKPGRSERHAGRGRHPHPRHARHRAQHPDRLLRHGHGHRSAAWPSPWRRPAASASSTAISIVEEQADAGARRSSGSRAAWWSTRSPSAPTPRSARRSR